MAKIDVPIVAARYTDEGHDHAIVLFHGDHDERMISKRDNPHVWQEMLRTVTLTWFQPAAHRSLHAKSDMTIVTPALAAIAPPWVDPPQQVASHYPMLTSNPSPNAPDLGPTIAALQHRIAELEAKPAAASVDLDHIAGRVASALDGKLAEIRRMIPSGHEGRLLELEGILSKIYMETGHLA